jgi:hypothetical protein
MQSTVKKPRLGRPGAWLVLVFLGTLAAEAVPELSAAGAGDGAALEAVVAETQGKVEVKRGDGDWTPAKVGDVLKDGTVISTGFKSTATLKLGEDTLTVKPVTRLSLEELVKTAGGTRTKLFLTVGRVRAEVNPSKRQNVEFSIKSPTATASVRGTGFETDGVNLVVIHGLVQLESISGGVRKVGGGEYSRVDGAAAVIVPVSVDPGKGLDQLESIEDQATVDRTAQGVATVIPVAVPTAQVKVVVQ